MYHILPDSTEKWFLRFRKEVGCNFLIRNVITKTVPINKVGFVPLALTIIDTGN